MSQAGFKGWIDKDEIVGEPGSAQIGQGVLAVHLDVIGLQQQFTPVERGRRLGILFDQINTRGIARGGLKTERTRTGKQIQAARARGLCTQPVEERRARSVCTWPQSGDRWKLELSPSPLTPDNTHFIFCHGLILSESSEKNEPGLWRRLRKGLSKTRSQLGQGVGNLLLGEKEVSDDVLEDLETALLITDVGVAATKDIMERLATRVKRRELNNTLALHAALRELLIELLQPMEATLNVEVETSPCVIFFVGVNGVGKTTTIGKLARQLQNDGRQVVLAAGDTFRAAAVEQLQAWGERNNKVQTAPRWSLMPCRPDVPETQTLCWLIPLGGCKPRPT